MLSIKHKGQTLTQEQLEAITSTLNHFMSKGMARIKDFEQECEWAMERAGCPFTLEKTK